MRTLRFKALIEYEWAQIIWEYYSLFDNPIWNDGNGNDFAVNTTMEEPCKQFRTMGKVIVKDLQFTGLKDKNGKDIYEGDIIDFHFATEFDKQVRPKKQVFYIESAAAFYAGELPLSSKQYKDINIVGNIYETPELLKLSSCKQD